MLSGLAAMIFLTACAATETSRPAPRLVLPTLDQYGAEFRERLARDIEADTRVLCPRDFVVPDCSAIKTWSQDYLHLRDRVRAARGR